MSWYETVFELIDMRSFSNLWFWIALAAVWSSASHYVLGVPYDMVTRAARQGGQSQDDLEALVRIRAARLLYIARVSGLWLVGLGAMGLTVLAVTGFWYGVELAQASFLIALPMSGVAALNLAAARRVAAGDLHGPALQRRLGLQRLWVQAIGIVSIFVTAVWGMYQNLSLGPLGG